MISWLPLSNRQYHHWFVWFCLIVKYIPKGSPMNEHMQTHVFSYRHDGRHWEVTLKATDAADARARIGKLAYATYDT